MRRRMREGRVMTMMMRMRRKGRGLAEQDAAPEASPSLQVADRPRMPQIVEWLCIPRPQWRPWKDKGKGKMRWEK
jgi:hypothetical protein